MSNRSRNNFLVISGYMLVLSFIYLIPSFASAENVRYITNSVDELSGVKPIVDVEKLYSQDRRGMVSEGLQATAELDMKSMPGIVVVSVSLRNVTSTTLYVAQSMPARDCTALIEKSNGEIIPCKGKPILVTSNFVAIVKPNECVVTKYPVFLPNYKPVDDTYNVTIARHIFRLDGEGESDAISNTVTFTIKDGKVQETPASEKEEQVEPQNSSGNKINNIVAVRDLLQKHGFYIKWDSANKKLIAAKSVITVEMVLGSSDILINDVKVNMGDTASIKNGVICAPGHVLSLVTASPDHIPFPVVLIYNKINSYFGCLLPERICRSKPK